MLYKFCTMESFADEPDRIGVIQADSIEEAAARLIRWNKEDQDWGDYTILGEPKVETTPDQATVTYNVHAQDTEEQGKDSYVIRPIGSDILSFLAEDWKQVFD